MATGRMNYQYGTSPRKIEPDYKVKAKQKTKAKQAKKVVPKKQKKKYVSQKKMIIKEENKLKVKICAYIVLTFSVFLAISYRNTQISQEFSKIQALKTNTQEIQKENEQLEMSIQNSLNATNMEDAAKQLGMQKLNSNQKVYIQIEKKDYVQPSAEEVVIQENSWIDNVKNALKSLFK